MKSMKRGKAAVFMVKKSKKRGNSAVFKAKRTKLVCNSHIRKPLSSSPAKQLSTQKTNFVREHHCSLLRNLEKARRLQRVAEKKVKDHPRGHAVQPEDMVHTGLTAQIMACLTQTRGLTSLQDNANVNQFVKLAVELSC